MIERAQLRTALAMLEAGDVLVVTRLGRLARSARDLLETWLGGLAEFERELIRARIGEAASAQWRRA